MAKAQNYKEHLLGELQKPRVLPPFLVRAKCEKSGYFFLRN